MRRAIRENLREFIAIGLLIAVGLATTLAVISRQGVELPGWVPVVGSDRFEIRAELSAAQAVTPGQGQTVNVAGIDVGDVTDVTLDDGVAVVTMDIDARYGSLLHRDATMLLRPRTPLQDMTLQLDRGTEAAGQLGDGDTIPLAQTAPNVQTEELLSTLDGDSRAYLKLLLGAAGQGLDGRGEQLGAGLRQFEPLARNMRRLTGALAKRQDSVRRAVHSLRLVGERLGADDVRLAEFVEFSNDVLDSFADQEASVRAALRQLPGTLEETRAALGAGQRFARVLEPASRDLVPAGRALGPGLRATRPLLRGTVGTLRDQLRPFTRKAGPPVRHLAQAAGPLGKTTRGVRGSLDQLNELTSALAHNPDGAAEEGYLFWLAWLAHTGNGLFFSQDAQGPMLRAVAFLTCTTAGLVEGIIASRPFLLTVAQGANVSQSIDPRVCPPL